MKAFLPLFALVALCASAPAANPPERTRLYTAPDPASPGGLKGRITNPAAPIEQILAIPAANIETVWQGEITGAKKDTFQFKGLPVGKYDLVVVFEKAFYEGFKLTRTDSTITTDDRQKIEATIQKSEPFFTKKFIHRVEGESGRGNLARGVITYFRDKGSDLLLEKFEDKSNRPDFRRTFKLVVFKDVGPGWQIVRARDLYPVWMNPKAVLPVHHYNTKLSELRVADEIKDIGELDLSN
ncbi:MAG: carboxypeptidase-like regulatory domain-containing protein [Chthoniobacteraceae bacterium]